MDKVDQDRATYYHEAAHAVFAVLVCGGIREFICRFGVDWLPSVIATTAAFGRKPIENCLCCLPASILHLHARLVLSVLSTRRVQKK